LHPRVARACGNFLGLPLIGILVLHGPKASLRGGSEALAEVELGEQRGKIRREFRHRPSIA
jgi:hypothetical protein